jgi:hypothetical protein
MADTRERWRPVIGFEGLYEVSNAGRVRRLPSETSPNPRPFLKDRDTGDGYRIVALSRNGKPKNRRVHRLVAAAFLGGEQPDLDVNHKDGCRSHNAATNLEYVDRSGNMQHYWTMPHARTGEKHWSALVTEATVRQIRRDAAHGMSMPKLAGRHGIAVSTVYAIIHRITWKHVA